MNSFWVFLSTYSGLPYELAFLGLSLVFYYRKNLSKREHLIAPFHKIFIIIFAFLLFRLAGELLKSGFAFPRPCWDPAAPVLIKCPHSFSFPSGHALGSFMLAILVSLIYRSRLISLASLILAALIALSRYLTGVHTILDIGVGSLLGIIFGCLIYRFYWRK